MVYNMIMYDVWRLAYYLNVGLCFKEIVSLAEILPHALSLAIKDHMTIIKEPVYYQKFLNEYHAKSMTSKVNLRRIKNYTHYINQSQHADFLHLFFG